MKDVVSETLKKWRQTSFGYDNQNDCLLSLADYLIDCGYPDFGKKFRGTFSDEKGALDYISKYGSVENIIDETSLIVVSEPKRGDIVLIKFTDENFLAGIFTGSSVMFRSTAGVLNMGVSACRITKVWNV
mgnify:CR=1 FL=1